MIQYCSRVSRPPTTSARQLFTVITKSPLVTQLKAFHKFSISFFFWPQSPLPVLPARRRVSTPNSPVHYVPVLPSPSSFVLVRVHSSEPVPVRLVGSEQAEALVVPASCKHEHRKVTRSQSAEIREKLVLPPTLPLWTARSPFLSLSNSETGASEMRDRARDWSEKGIPRSLQSLITVDEKRKGLRAVYRHSGSSYSEDLFSFECPKETLWSLGMCTLRWALM